MYSHILLIFVLLFFSLSMDTIAESSRTEIQDIVLTIEAPFSSATITILGNGRIIYQAQMRGGEKMQETGVLNENQMRQLAQVLEIINFFDLKNRLQAEGDPEDGANYTISAGIKIFSEGSPVKTIFMGTHSVTCYQDKCEEGFLKLKNTILQIWGKDILEIGV